MFDPERLLKQVMSQALSGSLGGKKRRHKSSYGSSSGLGGLLGGSSSSSGLGGLLGGSSSSSGLGGLLGGVLGGGGSRSGGMSTATKAKIGLGALGVAIAAYEHYKSKGSATTPAHAPPPQPVYGSAPPPPPPASYGAPPAPPTATPAADPVRADEAMHLLRAMICAANADGLIDADERQRILGSAREAGLDADDIAALEGELAAPLTVAQLVARTRPAQREQVYVASVIAIGRDTDIEVRYLDDLARALGLDAGTVQQLQSELGL